MMKLLNKCFRSTRGDGAHFSSSTTKGELSLKERFPDFDDEGLAIIRRCKPFTMTSPERLFALIQAIRYVSQSNLQGSLVECGVWKGGSMMAVAETLMSMGHNHRELFLYDTYEGMPPASESDRDYHGELASDLMKIQDPKTSVVWAIAQLEEVQRNLQSTQYPSNRIHYVQGKVEDTIPAIDPGQIALLRLDTDWYESTKHELVNLYPKLAPGGVLIIDDYGHWQGARQAVDEYFAENHTSILLNRIDYTGRIAIKPAS